jgi:hypothetical protein
VTFGRTAGDDWSCHYVFVNADFAGIFGGGTIEDPWLKFGLEILSPRMPAAAVSGETLHNDNEPLVPYDVELTATAIFGRTNESVWEHQLFWTFANANATFDVGPVHQPTLVEFLEQMSGEFANASWL